MILHQTLYYISFNLKQSYLQIQNTKGFRGNFKDFSGYETHNLF